MGWLETDLLFFAGHILGIHAHLTERLDKQA